MRPIVIMILSLFIGSASAQSVNIDSHHGDWSHVEGRDTSDTRVCGAVTINSSKQVFMVKHYAGNDYLTIQLVDKTWNIEDQLDNVPVNIRIRKGTVWNVPKAIALGNRVEFALTDIARFVNQLKSGSSMTIEFPEAAVKPWKMSLSGSDKILDDFVKCIKNWSNNKVLDESVLSGKSRRT